MINKLSSLIWISVVLVAGCGGSSGTGSDGTTCVTNGSCLDFESSATLVWIDWFTPNGAADPPAGAISAEFVTADFPVTCADVTNSTLPLTTSSHYLTAKITCGGSMGDGSCPPNAPLSGTASGQVPAQSFNMNYGAVTLRAPSGTYLATSGTLSVSALSEMSATGAVDVQVSNGETSSSFAVSVALDNATYCGTTPP